MSNIEKLKSQVEYEVARRKARTHYYDYVLFTNPTFKRTKFHEYLCGEIDKFLSTDSNAAFDILLLSVPPQSGKSTSVTEALPSYYLGKYPTKNVIVAGYSEDFAKRFGRRNQRKLEEFGAELFNFKPAENPWNTTEFESEQGGRCISRGLLSGITGNPANLFIIDDPVKNMQEALSDTTRASIQDEFYASVVTRIAPHGKLIVIQTRWHEDDLFGHIEKNFPKAKVINLPCEAEPNDLMGRPVGAPLVPELGKGEAWLKDFKEMYCSENGERAWDALYQGHPNIEGGNIFLTESWKYYDEPPVEIPYRVLSVDCTFKKSDVGDFVAIQDWGKVDQDYYLLGRIKKRLTFSETVDEIRNYLNTVGADNFDAVYIEDKANGSAVIDMLSREFDNIIPVNPEGGKVARAQAVAHHQNKGHVYLPKHAVWLDEYKDEFAKFPNAKHDDEVDAMTQALNRLSMIGAALTPTGKRTKYSKWTQDMWEDYDNAPIELQTQLLQLWGEPIEWAV